jgi:hypothetical protein
VSRACDKRKACQAWATASFHVFYIFLEEEEIISINENKNYLEG